MAPSTKNTVLSDDEFADAVEDFEPRAGSPGPTAEDPEEPRFYTLEEVGSPDPHGGVRITVVPGLPAPWAEALRNVLEFKRIPYKRVEHALTNQNQNLLWRLTRQRSVPTLFFNDERPRNNWTEQVNLAERIGPGPPLIPPAPVDRVAMFGLLNEVCGENGIGWNMRILSVDESEEKDKMMASCATNGYGYSAEAVVQAPPRIAQALQVLKAQLDTQTQQGYKFFFGKEVTALDIYWASFSILFKLPDFGFEWSKSVRRLYKPPKGSPECPQMLLDHRDWVFSKVLVKARVLGRPVL